LRQRGQKLYANMKPFLMAFTPM